MFKSRCIHIYTSKDGVIRLLLSVVESSHRGIPTVLLTCKISRAGGAWLTSCEMQALPVLKYEKIALSSFCLLASLYSLLNHLGHQQCYVATEMALPSFTNH